MYKYEQQTIKIKHKSKGREMQPQDNTKTCYQRGNLRTRRKTSPRPSKSKSIYPMYLNPPSSSYQWTSRSHVFSSFSNLAICPIASTKPYPASFGKSPKLSKLQNTLYTLKRYGLCLGMLRAICGSPANRRAQ